MNRRLIVPYLMGQRRDGLCRVRDMDCHDWEVLTIAEFNEGEIGDTSEKLRRMGKIYSLLADAVRERAQGGFVPVSIAGDCISALGVLGGLQQAGKAPDRIVWLDAHGDFHTWNTTQTKYLGGMPLAMLVGRGDRRGGERNAVALFMEEVGVKPYPEEQIVLSDARDLDPGERESLRDSRIIVCGISEISGYLASNESLYIHFDTDVMDAEADIPALKYHVRNGPKFAELCALFELLGGYNIIAISVSAWHEEKDVGNVAAISCLKLLEYLV